MLSEEQLRPLVLSTVLSVPTNPANITKVVSIDGFQHAPCFTQCVSLVVREFLEGDDQVEALLSTARKIYDHVSQSCAAHCSLEMEASLARTLFCHQMRKEIVSGCNSAFYMLACMYEQGATVQEFYLQGPCKHRQTPASI